MVRSTVVFACACAFVSSAFAQGTPRTAGSAPPSVTAIHAEQPPRIDGTLDDPVWKAAHRLQAFTQKRPVEGAPATEQTDVYIAYDATKLFIGIYAHYSDRSLIRANRVDRDKTSNDDLVSITLDPFQDQQRGYQFSVNGFGIQADALVGATSSDSSWTALYESAGALVEDGWVAEMAIPFKSIRYPQKNAGQQHRWALQIERTIEGKDEAITWAPVSSNILGTLTQMGVVTGLQNLSMTRNLEILPTVTAIQQGKLDPEGRFNTSDVEDAGLNVKYGLTSNLTLDVTYNPDFSQIESDRPQIEFNQRFPVFYPELRPFFIEGQEIFAIGIGPPTRPLHTRAIVDPQIGAKLTGKVGRDSIGVLVANDQAPGRTDDRLNPAFDQSAKILVGRYRHDLYTNSFFGALVTNREFLSMHSRLGGLDAQFLFAKNYQLQLKIMGSDHRDALGVTRKGHLLDVMHRKAGKHFSYLVAENDVTPGFKSDLGFVPRTYRRPLGNATYLWWPEKRLISWGPKFTFDHSEDYDTGELIQQIRQLSVSSTWAKNISLSTNINDDRERFNDVDFRKQRLSVTAAINSSRKASTSITVSKGDEIRYVTNPFPGTTTAVNASVTLRPTSRLQADLSVNTTRFTDLRTNAEVFDVKIFYAQTTYQFTSRLLVRTIVEHNTLNKTVGLNLLGTYRVNAGTAFFVGYDDRYRQGDMITARMVADDQYRRTNRAVFTKLQYLYRR
jgi:hypothetical protein